MESRVLSRNLIYKSRWVNLYVDQVQFPNGSLIAEHHLLDFDHPAVMVVPRDETGRYLMMQVFRYPTGRTEWEFPAGSIEASEDALAAARRELLEETGYRACDFELIYTYHPMNGIANQVFHVARCRVEELSGSFDPVEITAVRWFAEAEVEALIRSGEMRDGYSLTAFLLHKHL